MRLIRRWLTIPRLAIAGAVFLAIGGVAYAERGDGFIGPHGYINTCLSPRGGGVAHVWRPGHRCSGGWVPLAFAAHAGRGPQGARGATGPAGAVGATGPTGATGPSNPSATTVDGETVSKLMLKEPTPGSGTASVTIYSADGLTIVAECAHTGAATLVADGPGSADSELTVSGYQSGGSGYFGSQTNTLGPSSAVPLGPADAGHSSFSYADSAGHVITGQIGYQNAPSFNNYQGCAFFGTATSG
jgi:hypothetical protein